MMMMGWETVGARVPETIQCFSESVDSGSVVGGLCVSKWKGVWGYI